MERSSHALADIAAAQARNTIFAFDRDRERRFLARLQRIYAVKLTQQEAFYSFMDEGQPDIVLRSASQELALRLPACPQIGEIYSGLRDALDNELRDLESQIVAAHIDVERDRQETEKYPRESPDYIPSILALCTPAEVSPSVPSLVRTVSAVAHAVAA